MQHNFVINLCLCFISRFGRFYEDFTLPFTLSFPLTSLSLSFYLFSLSFFLAYRPCFLIEKWFIVTPILEENIQLYTICAQYFMCAHATRRAYTSIKFVRNYSYISYLHRKSRKGEIHINVINTYCLVYALI